MSENLLNKKSCIKWFWKQSAQFYWFLVDDIRSLLENFINRVYDADNTVMFSHPNEEIYHRIWCENHRRSSWHSHRKRPRQQCRTNRHIQILLENKASSLVPQLQLILIIFVLYGYLKYSHTITSELNFSIFIWTYEQMIHMCIYM